MKSMKEGEHMARRGLLIVFSGPSGVGKGTVRKAIFSDLDHSFEYSISATTRKPRFGEVDGVDYHFLTREKFEEMIQAGEMLEYAEYVGNYYGTPLNYVEETLEKGQDVFLEIEVKGAAKVKEQCPDAVFIFLTPPDLQELRNRIIGRGTDALDVINQRMKTAREEIEMMALYDYAVVNDVVERAAFQVKQIIASEHLCVKRVIEKYREMLNDMDKE